MISLNTEHADTLIKAAQKRRSYYSIKNSSTVSDDELEKYLKEALKNLPSAYNSNSARVVLLLNENHNRLWEITREELLAKHRRKNKPEKDFEKTDKKIDGFKAGYASLLLFEDQTTIEELQEKMPNYAEQFAQWSEHSHGIVLITLWTLLEQLGLGATVQHYNPLIDEKVYEEFDIPKTWKLIAQMPFGEPVEEPEDKEKLAINERFFVKK